MNNLVFKNFEMTRGFFLKEVEGISQEVASFQPDGFNNNIHWHIGHVLTVTEQFMFGFPRKTTNLPPNYLELFGNGTKPANWTENVPSVEELVVQLKDQVGRLNGISEDSLNKSLIKPFLGLETFGQLANMALFHEANHLGQIHTMKRIVQVKL
ncbi:DinB family protein [Neobacillus sp. D3-1R]|uniref:DinB family protein n=1 Tax=Neobacillus sp. D3-1R TaxID=3445778 RepID=UPI003F9F9521